MAYFEHMDDEFDFGKYKGLSLSDVMDINPEYIIWCMLNICNNQYCEFIISDEAMKELKAIYTYFPVIKCIEDTREQRMLFDYSSDTDENEMGYDNESLKESSTYDRYGGSYAQDELGYSDDEIDTIFDGDTNAYWNID